MEIREFYTFNAEDKSGDYNKGILRKGELTNNGYIRHQYLCSDGKKRRILEHRAKWVYFNGKIPEGLEIDHINGDRADNRMSNLRLLTHPENCNTDVAISRKKNRRHTEEWKKNISKLMRNNEKMSKKVIQVKENGEVIEHPSISECGRLGYSYRHVYNACYGKNYSKGHEYKGSYWYFSEDYRNEICLI